MLRHAGALAAAAVPTPDRMILWAPVAFSLGILSYFHAAREPSGWTVAIAMALAVAATPLIMRGPRGFMFGFLAAALICAGFAAAALRAQMVAAPVLAASMDATVEGRVAVLSRSRSDQLRAELADPVIYGLARSATPQRVRVSLLEG
ncbi:MAG: competence protein ComEC, partial [Paracoccaceae bacterium]